MIPIDLTGKTALVTGGTRGIGRTISLTLARAGAAVGAMYCRDPETASRTLADLRKLPDGEAHFVLQADIAVAEEAEDAVRTAGERFAGALDFLILNAAAGGLGELVDMSFDEWKRPFDVNVHGAFHMVRAAAPLLRARGAVVFISSGAGHDPLAGMSAYGASKAAVNHMAAILAQELGPRGVRVNVVSPGHTYREPGPPDALTPAQQQIADSTALRRIGTALDVANAVLFFVSDLSGFVTGQWLRVNGGRV